MKRIKLKIGNNDPVDDYSDAVIDIPYCKDNVRFVIEYLMNLKDEIDRKEMELIELRSSIKKASKGISANDLIEDPVSDDDTSEDSDKIPKGFDDFRDWMDKQGAEFNLSDYQKSSKVSDYLLNRYGYWIVKEDLAYQLNADRFHKK